MGTKRSRATLAHANCDRAKKFPSYLRATLKSLRRFWPEAVRPGRGRTPLKFAQQFLGIYNEVTGIYGKKPITESALKRVIDRLEGNGEVDISEITFAKIR